MKKTDKEFAEMIQKLTEEMNKLFSEDEISKARGIQEKMAFLIDMRLKGMI